MEGIKKIEYFHKRSDIIVYIVKQIFIFLHI